MKIDKAIKILKNYNEWRVGEILDRLYPPKEITKAINTIIEYHERPVKTAH